MKRVDPPAQPRWLLRYAAALDGVREGIDERIRSAIGGDAGAIASALITGKRDAISAPANEAMYVSSLAHVLSISGYHMAVVAGVVFFFVRALLAMSPGLALRFPIKKWAALAALAAAALYLLLSGAAVATQRAFIMTAIVLAGVLLDRPALTLRTLAVAAFAVLLLSPEAVVHPSFQMSFAATLALVAAYERGLPWSSGSRETALGARMALWGGREILGLILVSLVAGLATTPYAAYHFHRLAPYGVVANLLAMPIVSVWVMPAGLVALIAMPFGFDGALWRLMGEGIGWMIAVASWVASLPGAVGRIAAFGTGALALGTTGLIVLCLLRTPLRWSGATLIAVAALAAVRAPQPDVLVAPNAAAVAVRGADGRLSMYRRTNDVFAVRDWLAADADARDAADASLRAGFTCDEIGCVARLSDGAFVAVALTAEAFEDDCLSAALVVSPRDAPPRCDAVAMDRKSLDRSGAMAAYRTTNGFVFEAARPQGALRPWFRRSADSAPLDAIRPPSRGPERDATPRAEDLEPGD